MKRYRDNAALIILNIILEYVLIISTYLLCGYIRSLLKPPYAMLFTTQTIFIFLPFIFIVGIAMVIAFFVSGDYYTLHFKNTTQLTAKVFAISLMGGILCSALLFWVEGEQFSRILLGIDTIAWTLVITVKRSIFVKMANNVFADKIAVCNVIVMGNGANAIKYTRGLIADQSNRYNYLGYIAQKSSPELSNYLGDYSDIYGTISQSKAEKVVIAEENINRKFLNDVLSVCNMFGIEAVIVPVYADYIVESQKVRTDNGLHVLNVSAFDTSNILGVHVNVTDMDKTVSDIRDNLDSWRGKYICVSNVHTTVMAHDNPEYRKVQNGAVMALPDGGPLSSYSRAEGKKDAKRVTGPDLMREILTKSGEHGWRHFFYGSTDKTLEMLKEKIEKDYPGATIAGMVSPPYRELTAEEDAEYVETINASNPDFIWVGLGAPKQEVWMAAHENRVNGIMIGVGAAFDYESGNLKRAPKWMQKCNLEWFYRFMQEPRRLFKRYFVTNIKFLWLTRR